MIKKMAKEAKKYIADNVKNRIDIDFDILVGEKQIIKLKDFDYEYDGRLEKLDYLNNSFTIIVMLKETKKIIGKATFFVLDYSMWKEIALWRQEGEFLKRENLNTFFKDTSKKCIIMGYGQTSNAIQTEKSFLYKGKIMDYYYLVLKFLLKGRDVILYCEPCGYYCLSDQILGEDSKKLSISNYEKKGQVCKESIVSEKIVKHLLFSKMELCYHYSSLGPVYYKQI